MEGVECVSVNKVTFLKENHDTERLGYNNVYFILYSSVWKWEASIYLDCLPCHYLDASWKLIPMCRAYK